MILFSLQIIPNISTTLREKVVGLSVLKVFAFWGKKYSLLLLVTIDYFSVFGIIFFLCPNLE